MSDMYAAMLAAADAKKKYGGTDGVGLPPRLSDAALNATYAPLATLLIDGGNATSIYTTTFNIDGGSATS